MGSPAGVSLENCLPKDQFPPGRVGLELEPLGNLAQLEVAICSKAL